MTEQILKGRLWAQTLLQGWEKKNHILNAALLGAALMFAYVSFLYADLTDTYENSILFVKAAYHGRLGQFYSYTIEQSQSFWAANYDFLIYVIYGIWNLPVLLCAKIIREGGIYLTWAPGLLWCKTLGVFLCLWNAYLIYRILLLIRTPKKFAKLGAFLFLSSTALYLIVFVLAQVDGFALLLLTGGLYYYLKGDVKRFYLCFTVAMPCKMFAVFLFIPLLLLIEKRLLFAAAKLALVFSLCLFSKVLFGNDPAYHFALGSQSRDAMSQIMDSNFYMGHTVILFLLSYMGLCAYCYVSRRYQEDRQEYQIPVCCAAAVWAIFVCFVDFNSYWVLYLLPFLVIAVVGNGRFLKVNCLLELVFSLGYVGHVVFYCAPLFDTQLVRRLFLNRILPVPAYENTRYGSLSDMAEDLGLSIWAPLFSTCMIGGLLIILVLSCPFLFKEEKRFVMPEPSVLWGRTACVWAVTGLLLYSYMKDVPPAVYSTLAAQGTAGQADLLEGQTWIGQELAVKETGRMEELQIFFENPDDIRNNFASVKVEIIRQEDGAVLFSHRRGCSMIPDGKRQDIALENLELEGGKQCHLVKLQG